MKLTRVFLILIGSAVAAFASDKNCGCACCKGKEVCCCHAEEAKADAGHPLKGVVTKVLEERKLVMIKHEEIPGVMKAMTMAFSVPDGVWAQLKPGTALTARMHKAEKGWKLTEVKVLEGAAAK